MDEFLRGMIFTTSMDPLLAQHVSAHARGSQRWVSVDGDIYGLTREIIQINLDVCIDEAAQYLTELGFTNPTEHEKRQLVAVAAEFAWKIGKEDAERRLDADARLGDNVPGTGKYVEPAAVW
jgi:hypothetical protein